MTGRRFDVFQDAVLHESRRRRRRPRGTRAPRAATRAVRPPAALRPGGMASPSGLTPEAEDPSLRCGELRPKRPSLATLLLRHGAAEVRASAAVTLARDEGRASRPEPAQRLLVVRGERLTHELGDARSHARTKAGARRGWERSSHGRTDAWKAIANRSLPLSADAEARQEPILRRRTRGPRPRRQSQAPPLPHGRHSSRRAG
jgi:hypothetical protein